MPDRRLQRQANRLELANQTLSATMAALETRQAVTQVQAARQANTLADVTYSAALSRLSDISSNGRTYTPTQVQAALVDLAAIVQRLLRATAP